MGRRHVSPSEEPRPLPPPARTQEEREKQLIGMAYDLAERQIADGTASAQVITGFLRLGSSRERLEQERLRRENILLGAKAEALESAARMEELYAAAISAMREYSGGGPAITAEVVDDDFDDPLGY